MVCNSVLPPKLVKSSPHKDLEIGEEMVTTSTIGWKWASEESEGVSVKQDGVQTKQDNKRYWPATDQITRLVQNNLSLSNLVKINPHKDSENIEVATTFTTGWKCSSEKAAEVLVTSSGNRGNQDAGAYSYMIDQTTRSAQKNMPLLNLAKGGLHKDFEIGKKVATTSTIRWKFASKDKAEVLVKQGGNQAKQDNSEYRLEINQLTGYAQNSLLHLNLEKVAHIKTPSTRSATTPGARLGIPR